MAVLIAIVALLAVGGLLAGSEARTPDAAQVVARHESYRRWFLLALAAVVVVAFVVTPAPAFPLLAHAAAGVTAGLVARLVARPHPYLLGFTYVFAASIPMSYAWDEADVVAIQVVAGLGAGEFLRRSQRTALARGRPQFSGGLEAPLAMAATGALHAWLFDRVTQPGPWILQFLGLTFGLTYLIARPVPTGSEPAHPTPVPG